MTNKKLDPTFLQRMLTEMAGMNKTAAAGTSNERLADLARKAKENAELLKTACSTSGAGPIAKVGGPEPVAAEKTEAEKKADEPKKAALEHLKLATAHIDAPELEAAAVKSARAELALGIITEQILAPYDQIAKAAGLVTLNNLCQTYNR